MNVIDKLQAFYDGSSSTPNKAVDYYQRARELGHIRRYEKFGQVKARQATELERVETIIDGIVETTNAAKPGDWIITGVKGEHYVLTDEKFKSRYRHVAKDIYEATGFCWAVKYDGPSFTFEAPWGEQMVCNKHDYICSTTYDDDQGDKDVYRIERQAFLATYRLPPPARIHS